jgi:hypothetical protein
LRTAIGSTLLTVCVTGLLTPSEAQVSNATASSGVEIYITPLPTEIDELEPIWLELQFRNNLAEPVRVDLGPKRKGNTLISVWTDRGEIKTVPVDVMGLGPPPEVEIPSVSNFRLRLLLNERVPNLAPGIYSIRIQFEGRTETDLGRMRTSVDRQFTVKVLPIDTGKLAATCLSLSKRIENATDAGDADDAATALSYITHPIAVPYIAALLTRNPNIVVPKLMAGLERIGGPTATAFLIGQLDNNNPRIAGFARLALNGIAARTEGTLQERIRHALSVHPPPDSCCF